MNFPRFRYAPTPVGIRVTSTTVPGREGVVYHGNHRSPAWSVTWDDSYAPRLERVEDLVPIGIALFPAFVGPAFRALGIQFPPPQPDANPPSPPGS